MLPVGGLDHKLKAASKVKAKLVLLPESQREEASQVMLNVDYVSTVWELVSKALERPENSPEPGE